VEAGNSRKLIAAQLGISEETAKAHVKGILSKLGARDRTHAVTVCTQAGNPSTVGKLAAEDVVTNLCSAANLTGDLSQPAGLAG